MTYINTSFLSCNSLSTVSCTAASAPRARELAFYRPLAVKLEDELRIARDNIADTKRNFAALEADYVNAQGAHNDLFQRMASAEAARQRATEENTALLGTLNQHDFAFQALLRENANLKSETVSVASDLERAEKKSKSLADKYVDRTGGEQQGQGGFEFAAGRAQSISQGQLSTAHTNRTTRESFNGSSLNKGKTILRLRNQEVSLNSKIDFLLEDERALARGFATPTRSHWKPESVEPQAFGFARA